MLFLLFFSLVRMLYYCEPSLPSSQPPKKLLSKEAQKRIIVNLTIAGGLGKPLGWVIEDWGITVIDIDEYAYFDSFWSENISNSKMKIGYYYIYTVDGFLQTLIM